MAETRIKTGKAGATDWVETLLVATNAASLDSGPVLRGCAVLHPPAALAKQLSTLVHICLAALRRGAN